MQQKRILNPFVGFLLLLSVNTNLYSQVQVNDSRIEKFKVYFFLATTCPISQQYTKEINTLFEKYHSQGIDMMLVFPYKGKKSIKKEVLKFKKLYNLEMPIKIDKNFTMTKKLRASVTPEAFLLDSEEKVLYHGAIDNWYYQLGKNRINITEHYLEDAIILAKEKKIILKPYIEPVGCFIEVDR